MPMMAMGFLAAVTGCERPDRDAWAVDPPMTFDTARAVIETAEGPVPLLVELAETESQRAQGLMDRPSLPPEQGMLFVYPETQDGRSGFWMYRTLIPLEIAFLDDDGEIVAILEMEPCPSPNPQLCPIYSPGVPYVAALEVNRSFFGQWRVRVGDRFRLETEGDATS